jgi:hypothetical protein
MNRNLRSNILFFSLAAFCFSNLVFCAGCGETTPVSTKVATERKELPKFSFHKPRNYALAVERVAQIHRSLVSEGDFPTPTSYTVTKVEGADDSNVTQASYQLVEGSYESEARHECCDHHCDHEGEDHSHSHRDPFAAQSEKHTVIVDAFSELSDIVGWLPSIASDSELYSADIDTIKATSEEMLSTLNSVAGDTEESKLESYRTKVDALDMSVEKLESMVKENGAKVLAD